MKKIYTLGLIVTLLLGSGCATQSNMGKGAAYGTAGGAAAGAILGQIIGGNTKSTLIGTAAGAVIGGLAGTGIGSMMDRQENDMRQALANSQAKEVDLLVTWLFRLTQEYYNYKMAAVIGIVVFVLCAAFTLIAFGRMTRGDREEVYQ